MTRSLALLSLTLVLAGCGGVKISSSTTEKPGVKEVKVKVPAKKLWVDTKVDVEKGKVYAITASGKVVIDTKKKVKVGPDGAPGKYPFWQEHRVLKGKPVGALIGRIGDKTAPAFFVGIQGKETFRAFKRTGRLYLSLNKTYTHDCGSGAFDVVVRIKDDPKAKPKPAKKTKKPAAKKTKPKPAFKGPKCPKCTQNLPKLKGLTTCANGKCKATVLICEYCDRVTPDFAGKKSCPGCGAPPG